MPALHQDRGSALQIQFANQSSAVIDQYPLSDPLQLDPFAGQSPGDLPAYLVGIETALTCSPLARGRRADTPSAAVADRRPVSWGATAKPEFACPAPRADAGGCVPSETHPTTAGAVCSASRDAAAPAPSRRESAPPCPASGDAVSRSSAARCPVSSATPSAPWLPLAARALHHGMPWSISIASGTPQCRKAVCQLLAHQLRPRAARHLQHDQVAAVVVEHRQRPDRRVPALGTLEVHLPQLVGLRPLEALRQLVPVRSDRAPDRCRNRMRWIGAARQSPRLRAATTPAACALPSRDSAAAARLTCRSNSAAVRRGLCLRTPAAFRDARDPCFLIPLQPQASGRTRYPELLTQRRSTTSPAVPLLPRTAPAVLVHPWSSKASRAYTPALDARAGV